jgi:hypothetical protein
MERSHDGIELDILKRIRGGGHDLGYFDSATMVSSHHPHTTKKRHADIIIIIISIPDLIDEAS